MRYETKTVRIGEWLGDVPADWDWEKFTAQLGQQDDYTARAKQMYLDMAAALKRGARVYATQSGDFTHEVLRCGLYDGWVFWKPRPCYSYIGPLPVEHIDEFYNLRRIRIEEPLYAAEDGGKK